VSSYDPERAPDIVKDLAHHGATQEEIASTLGITSRQLRTWRAQYPELRQAMDAGNEVLDTRVERALSERAIGYYERLCSVSVQLSVNLRLTSAYVGRSTQRSRLG
jgi:transposase-like protein